MFESNKWYKNLPNESLSIYEPHLKLFFELMYERQLIWKRRFIDKKERPWTNNKIFQDYKFTNVYRELDRNSQWQIKNILLDETLSLKNLVWKMMVFRFFNNPETFTFDAKNKKIQSDLFKDNTELISATKWKNGIPDYDEYNEDEFSKFISGVRASGQNPYTAAYLINSGIGQSRDYRYTRIVIPFLHKNMNNLIIKVKTAKKPEDIIEFLKTFPGIADFIAHEFYQDFTYISKYTSKKFMKFDQNDYTNVGPGASLGIRLIYPNLKTIKEQKRAIYQLKEIAEEMLNEIEHIKDEPFPYLGWNRNTKQYFVHSGMSLIPTQKIRYESDIEISSITLHQIEMWLCEFQKYWKVLNKVGKQRSKFEPKTKY